MPQLIKPGETKVVTKKGEALVNIALELTIKLDGSGLQITSGEAKAQDASKQDEDKVDWVVPDFTPSKNKLNFGKDA